MPIYEYECQTCKTQLEIKQHFDDPPPDCKHCASNLAMKKLISKSSFHLKGVGWYKTDYAKKR